MLEVTKFGKSFLAKNGIHVNKNGETIETPKHMKDLPRNNKLDMTEELERANDQEIQKIGSKIGELINKYYTEPSTVTSNRGKKMEKKLERNYEVNAEIGYVVGDRLLFWNLAKEMASVCKNPNQRPAGELIFRRLMRIMDKKPDKPGPVSNNCW
jgi:hypothetical protein